MTTVWHLALQAASGVPDLLMFMQAMRFRDQLSELAWPRPAACNQEAQR